MQVRLSAPTLCEGQRSSATILNALRVATLYRRIHRIYVHIIFIQSIVRRLIMLNSVYYLE